MELKLEVIIIVVALANSFNRTFMELKHRIGILLAIVIRVLIGPSWN